MIRASLPFDQRRVAAYERLMEAQELIAQARARVGATDAEIDAALEASEPSDPESLTDDELYVDSLTTFVAALGGRLDESAASAVFGGDTIALPVRGA